MSADKIDHKAEAEYLQDRGSNSPLDGSYSFQNDTETLLSALTSATLYAAEQTAALVEQQRVANLLTAAALVPDKTKPFGLMRDVEKWAEDSDAELHSALADPETWIALLGSQRAKKRGLA